MPMALFKNRIQAADELARDLEFLRGEDPVVVGIPNGGVPVAAYIAEHLNCPLDILLMEPLTAPRYPDHVVGAVDEHGRISIIQATARWHHVTSQQLVEPARKAYAALQERRGQFRAILPELDLAGRTVIVINEGVSTGAKMLGAITSVRDRGAKKVVAAAPAGPAKNTWILHENADLVVIPHHPTEFKSIQHFYSNYEPVTDNQVVCTLQKWVVSRPDPTLGVRTIVHKLRNEVGTLLHCEIDLPPDFQRGADPRPAVVFAHGFESHARSPRSVPISKRLAKRGVLGVRFDFTGHGQSQGKHDEATDERMLRDLNVVFRTVAAMKEVDGRRIGINGAGTGGMIALHFAAIEPTLGALVIRGPVCEHEIDAARRIKAPTLLIHAEQDTALGDSIAAIDNNLAATHHLLVVHNSNRLFGDPISHELMVSASVDWLADHLLQSRAASALVDQAG
jgi:putative phosphoribosyl transferase